MGVSVCVCVCLQGTIARKDAITTNTGSMPVRLQH